MSTHRKAKETGAMHCAMGKQNFDSKPDLSAFKS